MSLKVPRPGQPFLETSNDNLDYNSVLFRLLDDSVSSVQNNTDRVVVSPFLIMDHVQVSANINIGILGQYFCWRITYILLFENYSSSRSLRRTSSCPTKALMSEETRDPSRSHCRRSFSM